MGSMVAGTVTATPARASPNASGRMVKNDEIGTRSTAAISATDRAGATMRKMPRVFTKRSRLSGSDERWMYVRKTAVSRPKERTVAAADEIVTAIASWPYSAGPTTRT